MLACALAAAAGCHGQGNATGDTSSGLCTPLAPVPPRLWRLSVQQYSNSVRDLLGIAAGPTLDTTGGTSAYAFFSDDNATVDATLAFQLNAAARQLMTANAAIIPGLAACQPGEAETDCATRFARTFGRRAYRRPLDDSEVQSLMGAYTRGRLKDFNHGISLMVQAFIQSPSFLFRSELGTSSTDATTSLGPYEVVTQLSYTFLDTAPDDTLLDAADSGALATPEGVAAQVDRLLGTDAAQKNLDRIVGDWFNARQLYAKSKDTALLAAVGADAQNQSVIMDDLYASVLTFVDDVLWNGGGAITDLYTSQRLFVNQRLATLYGLPFSGDDPKAFVAVDGQSDRAGMLTHPAVLWAASDPAATSIVKRGKFVHDNVVCGAVLPPPSPLLNDPNIQMMLAELMTEKAKSDYRLGNLQCSPCHTAIDPYGLILEGFDPIGRSRTQAEDGAPVDPTGDFSADAPLKGTITGPVAFTQAITDDKQLTTCAAQMMASYALGRMIRATDLCEVQKLRDDTEKADGKLTTLLRLVATSSFARTRAGGAQ